MMLNRHLSRSFSVSPTQTLYLHLVINLHRSRLHTKDGRIKRLDVSNRIKILEDALANWLGFDDSQVWHVSATKKEIPPGETERVTAILGCYEIKTGIDLVV